MGQESHLLRLFARRLLGWRLALLVVGNLRSFLVLVDTIPTNSSLRPVRVETLTVWTLDLDVVMFYWRRTFTLSVKIFNV